MQQRGDLFYFGSYLLLYIGKLHNIYPLYLFRQYRKCSYEFYNSSNFWPPLNVGAVMLGNDRMLFSSPVFWLGLVLIPLAVLLLDITVKA